MSTSSLSSLPESSTRTPPPASAPAKSSPVGKVPPYFIPHKRGQVQAFDETVQQLELLTPEQFLKCLGVRDDLLPSEIPNSARGLSNSNFCLRANVIARSIKARHFPRNGHLLVFRDTEHKTPDGHVTGTRCRPDITAAFDKDWITDDHTDDRMNWALIRLAGEKASAGKTSQTQMKNAATYLHYLLLARPDLLVAQGLLTTQTAVFFFVGIGGVGIRQLNVGWDDENLYKFLYAFIYRLYDPSHFANSSFKKLRIDKETSEATYTVCFKKEEYPNFRTIHARNPFATRTHVLSNPSLTQRAPTVFKEQLCRTGRRFDELTILTKIHRGKKVPGVVEAVFGEIVEAPLSPERQRHLLGLRQTGSPFTSIRTAKKMLEMLFDLLEVLRYLRFEREILHRDISIGNVMYIENPEIPAQEAVEPLVFAKCLLDEGVPHETSLLLVDFNLGEDLENKKYEKRVDRTVSCVSMLILELRSLPFYRGTPIFISRAVERGKPVPLDTEIIYRVPRLPKSPECYASAHRERIKDFPEASDILVDPFELKNQSQEDTWRHELDHDVESVFWLLLYWAMVMQPEGRPTVYIDPDTWTSLLGNFKSRERLVLVLGLSSHDRPDNLTHPVYEPLWPLIRSLAAILRVDRHWLPENDVRKRPEYICEAFQRLILEFIVSNRDEDFMTCRVGDTLRQLKPVPESQALSTTPSQQRDGSERESEAERLRLGGTNRDENFMTCRVGDTLRQLESVAESQALSTTPSQQRDGSERENEAKRRRLGGTEDEGDGEWSLMNE